MITLDAYAHQSLLRGESPAAKAVFSFGSLAVCLIWGGWPACFFVMIAMGYMSVFRGGLLLRTFLQLCALPLGFVLIGAVTIAVTISSTPSDLLAIRLGSWWIGVSRTGLLQAVRLITRAAAGVCCLCFLYLSTPIGQLLGLLETCKIPRLVTELAMLIYRFIFLLLEQGRQIAVAQASRLGYRNGASALKSCGLLGGAAFVKAFHHADQCMQAMQARGYDGALPSLEPVEPCSNRVKWMLIGYLLMLMIIGGMTGWGLF